MPQLIAPILKVPSGPSMLKMPTAKKIDIKNHVLIPKQSKLSEKEKQELLKKYNISTEQLPAILKTDAAIASLNAKEGDVVKIERNSQTAGTAVFYRVVTNG